MSCWEINGGYFVNDGGDVRVGYFFGVIDWDSLLPIYDLVLDL